MTPRVGAPAGFGQDAERFVAVIGVPIKVFDVPVGDEAGGGPEKGFVAISGANVPDSQAFIPLVQGIPPIRSTRTVASQTWEGACQ